MKKIIKGLRYDSEKSDGESLEAFYSRVLAFYGSREAIAKGENYIIIGERDLSGVQEYIEGTETLRRTKNNRFFIHVIAKAYSLTQRKTTKIEFLYEMSADEAYLWAQNMEDDEMLEEHFNAWLSDA